MRHNYTLYVDGNYVGSYISVRNLFAAITENYRVGKDIRVECVDKRAREEYNEFATFLQNINTFTR